MFQAFEYKLNNVIGQRDRHLPKELQRSLEEKRMEIAASEENKPWKGSHQHFAQNIR